MRFSWLFAAALLFSASASGKSQYTDVSELPKGFAFKPFRTSVEVTKCSAFGTDKKNPEYMCFAQNGGDMIFVKTGPDKAKALKSLLKKGAATDPKGISGIYAAINEAGLLRNIFIYTKDASAPIAH
jgi:hypothetical protein